MYSVVIMNWLRPENVRFIVQTYSDYAIIDEIIVSNGRMDTAISDDEKYPKIKCHDDFLLNSTYGLDLRVLNGMRAKNRCLIICDDDLFLTVAEMEKLTKEFEKNTCRIVGKYGRQFRNGDYVVEDVYGEVDVVLTRFLVCERQLCQLFFLCKPIIESLYIEGKPYGNGEDIFLSFIAELFYGNRNVTIAGVKENSLPDKHGISHGSQHASYRRNFCKYLIEKEALIKSLLVTISKK